MRINQSRVSRLRIREFNRALFHYFKKQGRELLWRPPMLTLRKDGSCDPYKILVSEFMLQQTQVSRVTPKYQSFLQTFPTITSLANATLGQVLTAWSGLGYNRRARNLHNTARTICEKHHGRIPCDRESLELLPGIGHSTASGILAFAWNEPEPMIDTNIRRILERVFYFDTHYEITEKKSKYPERSLAKSKGKLPPSDKELYVFAQSIIPKGKGREWNYALLDIGASVCGARTHNDEQCPFTKLHGKVKLLPRKRPQAKFQDSDRYYRGRILHLLTVHRRQTRRQLFVHTKLPTPRLQNILTTLLHEKLIVRVRGGYQLP